MNEQSNSTWPAWLLTYIETYNNMTINNLELLEDIYDQDVVFIDPMSRIDGLKALNTYFEHLYLNLNECQFTVEDAIICDNNAAIYWQMAMSHKKIKGGKMLTVNGHSKLTVKNDLVIKQVDYFDVGSMIYEHIPVIGTAIKFIKQKAGH